jgi:hypothetical protein
MTQQWLNVLGLVLDFAGFMLLLREWWLAFFNERRQIEMQEQFERMQSMRNLRPRAPSEHNPYEALERMQDQQAVRKARDVHRSAMGARRGTFLLSTTLIVVGFVLQILAAWPGCCGPWIMPG